MYASRRIFGKNRNNTVGDESLTYLARFKRKKHRICLESKVQSLQHLISSIKSPCKRRIASKKLKIDRDTIRSSSVQCPALARSTSAGKPTWFSDRKRKGETVECDSALKEDQERDDVVPMDVSDRV